MALLVIASGADSEHGGAVDSSEYQLCANLYLAQCNWLVEKDPVRKLCGSCRLTRTRPNDTDTKALAAFAAAEKAKRRLIFELYELKLPITVCHYPPGTSKWNKIEHRLFSFISLNWKGEPLVNYETVVNLIGGTRTRSGLAVKAVLDTREYQTGLEISAEQVEELQLRRHAVHPDWNYTLSPSSAG